MNLHDVVIVLCCR